MKNNYLSKKRKLFVLSLIASLFLWGSGSAWAQKALPYSYGFEDYNLDTDGWTKYFGTSLSKNNNECAIVGDAKKTGSYGFRFSSAHTSGANAQYLISPELNGANGVNVSFYYKSSYTGQYGTESFKVGYSTTDTDVSNFTWDEEISTNAASWLLYENSFPAGTKYVAIYYYSNYKYRLYVDDFSFTAPANGPALTVADGLTTINSGYNYNFGLATPGTVHYFTLSNPGTESITLNIEATNGFSTDNTKLTLDAKASVLLHVIMGDATSTGTVTITPTASGIDLFVINVSGTVRDANKVYLDFADGQMPEGWSWKNIGSYASSSYYSISTGYASISGGSISYAAALTSPKLTFDEGELVAFETARYGSSTYYSPSITVEYSLDGSTWTAIGSAFTDDVYGTWTKRNVTIPVEGVKYIRFNGWYIHMRNIYGGQEPTVIEPKAFAASNITVSSADLSWTSTATSFNIQYKADGDADWTTIENVTANPYTLTDLTATTEYQARIQANFGAEGLSDYTDAISFTTSVAPITTYPYTEDFNSLDTGEIPAYWDNSEGTTTTAAYKWVHYAGGYEDAGLRFDSYNNSSNNTNFLKTRPFSFTEGQAMRLSFWYKNPKGGDFSVYASTDGGSTYTTELATGLIDQSDWTEKEIDIPATVYGDNVVILFKGTSNWGNGDAYIYLDEVTISEKSDYSVAVSGDDVNENTIAFGTVKNTTTTKTFTITNDGGNDLANISVVSSDEDAFTISETGFNLATGETKDITVTFVKAVEGDYSETVTVSQENITTPIVLTVTATYVTPTPATMAVTVDEAAVGETVAFGTVNKATTKTFTVSNTGEATLNATIALSGDNAANFALSTTSLEVAGESSETFTVTFDSDEEDVEKTATVTLSAEGLSDVTFDVTGTYVDMFSEDFEDGAVPAGWDNNGFVVKTGSVGNYPTYNLTSYVAVGNGGSGEKTLITPLLKATAGDKLTFDGFFYYGDETMKVDYSTDLTTWNNLYTYDKESYSSGTTHNIEIESAITGEFYLRFTVNYYNGIDNIVGFKLAPAKEHEAVIASTTIPAAGNQYVEYTASVTVKEKAGKDDEIVTAELWIGETKVATEADVTLNANDDKEITLTFTPNDAMSGDAYIKVYNDDIELTSTTTAVAIAAATVYDEADAPEVAEGTIASLVFNYTAKNGWNTICTPFALTDDILTAIFGDGWTAYEFDSYNNGTIGFKKTTTFYAGYPYLVYVETAATHAEGVKMQNISITRTTAQYDQKSDVRFLGTYAPIAAGEWTKNADTDIIYGVTTEARIAKAGANATIKGFRAYFDVPSTSAIKGMSLYDGDDATSIHGIALEGMEDGQLYDLSGRRVNPATTRLNGIYILNGKKVLFK